MLAAAGLLVLAVEVLRRQTAQEFPSPSGAEQGALSDEESAAENAAPDRE